jgi:hypothetical protein
MIQQKTETCYYVKGARDKKEGKTFWRGLTNLLLLPIISTLHYVQYATQLTYKIK